MNEDTKYGVCQLAIVIFVNNNSFLVSLHNLTYLLIIISKSSCPQIISFNF